MIEPVDRALVGSVDPYYLMVLRWAVAGKYAGRTVLNGHRTLYRKWNEIVDSLVTWTKVVYALHAFSLLTGIIGTATVVGAFLTGWPSILAVILNYIKRSDVRGTWLESHFRWQIRTFWFGLLWIALCLALIIMTLGIGLLFIWLPISLVGLWFVYRIVRGWITLADSRPMYL